MDPDMLREIREAIRTIPDYPKPGVTFRDITTLLGNARVFRTVVDQLVQPWLGARIDRVAGIEARGFILRRDRTSPVGGLRPHPQERQAPACHGACRLLPRVRAR